MGSRLPQPPLTGQLRRTTEWSPLPVRSLQDTGLNLGILSDLAIKVLYFGGYLSGTQIAEQMHLPFTNVVFPHGANPLKMCLTHRGMPPHL